MKKYIQPTLIILAILTSTFSYSQCFDEGHSPFKEQGWLSCNTSEGPIPERGDQHWVMYDFGEIYAIDSIQYWNHNAWGETGMGAKEILIDYSKDQVEWTWNQPQREWQMLGMKYLQKMKKLWGEDLVEFAEVLVVNKSWWDTVDFLATNVVGTFLDKRPEESERLMDAWNESDNMWKQRVSIIFQLKYKEEVKYQCAKRKHGNPEATE